MAAADGRPWMMNRIIVGIKSLKKINNLNETLNLLKFWIKAPNFYLVWSCFMNIYKQHISSIKLSLLQSKFDRKCFKKIPFHIAKAKLYRNNKTE